MPKTDPAARAIRVLVVDDHELFLSGLCQMIQREPGLTVAAQAVNRAEAIAAAHERPDIILLDLGLENENGLDFLPELLQAGEGAQVIVVTGSPDPEQHLRAVRLGARGVVLKVEGPGHLFKAIRKVHSGEVWLSRSMVSTVLTEVSQTRAGKKVDPEAEKISSLTTRELDVIGQISEGRRNKQIGERLFISEKTVRHYMTSIFDKLGVADRLELMIYSYQHGLAKISPPPTSGERMRSLSASK